VRAGDEAVVRKVCFGAVQVDLDALLERILHVHVVDGRAKGVRRVRRLHVDGVRVGVHDREIRNRHVASGNGDDFAVD
jgi:hypothetical protein